MKYRGVYWAVFASMIRGSIRKCYGSAMAAQAVWRLTASPSGTCVAELTKLYSKLTQRQL